MTFMFAFVKLEAGNTSKKREPVVAPMAKPA